MNNIVLVTGGTGGIGTAICRQLAENGYQVATSWLEGIDDGVAWQNSQKADGFDFTIASGDVSKFSEAEAMVKSVEEQLGKINILINCAGITRDAILRKMKPEQWDSVLRVNLDSVFNVTKHVIPNMMKNKWGRIVNISSVNGQRGQSGQVNYAAAKAGMHGFTMSLAQELAGRNITVNTISPGYIATEMVMQMPEKIRNNIVNQIPIGRLGTPEEVAWATSFLVNDKSSYITGANIALNGGMYM
jgi:acetoacetyl-CoA reductase